MNPWKEDEEDLSDTLILEPGAAEFSALARREARLAALPAAGSHAATAHLHGFDLGGYPLLAGLPGLPHEVVVARTTVQLLQAQIGSAVAVICDQGDALRPIVVGVLQEPQVGAVAPTVSAQVDGQKLVLAAEREIVLQCGAASITLTRAGKVVIKGTYVLSRSSGPNRVKGATVDIN